MTKETGAVRLNVDPQLPLESTNILIVGAGLIGGSYAQGLSRLGYRVRAINRSQESIDFGRLQLAAGMAGGNYSVDYWALS